MTKTFEFVTTFKLRPSSMDNVKSFIAKSFTSPYLEKKRKEANSFFKSSPKQEVKQEVKKESSGFSFDDIEKESSSNSEETNLRELSEDKLNNSLEELTQEDYEDFGEMGIEILDYILDRAFIYFGRRPSDNDSIANKKKERLKIIAGRLFQKWGVKFSLEMLGAFLLISYIHMRYKTSEKIEDVNPKDSAKKEPTKVIQLKPNDTKSDEAKDMALKEVKPKKRAGGLMS